MAPHVTLRDCLPTDEPFLYRVYASTREEELAPLAWSDVQKKQFLHMQFDAQHRYYHDQFTDAEFQIIILDGERIGRLYVDRRSDEIRLIDIALLPAYRNMGIGSELIGILLKEAQRVEKPVRIHVEQNNPAMQLYKRLGFVMIEEGDIYHLMQWQPDHA